MGRQLFALAAGAALFFVTPELSFAQGKGHHHGNGGNGGNPGYRSGRPGGGPGGMNQQRFYRLSPEEQQAFRRNAERWLQMNPDQQRMLRERETQRLQKMRGEADAAMRQSGLRLEGSAREQFEQRYLQERRRIERELRQEAEFKRQQQLPQLNEKLKSEFQGHQNNGHQSPNPSASAKGRD